MRVADEYDALVTKRQYTTHVNISETLKDLIKDAQPDPRFIALDQLNTHEKKENKWIDLKNYSRLLLMILYMKLVV